MRLQEIKKKEILKKIKKRNQKALEIELRVSSFSLMKAVFRSFCCPSKDLSSTNEKISIFIFTIRKIEREGDLENKLQNDIHQNLNGNLS